MGEVCVKAEDCGKEKDVAGTRVTVDCYAIKLVTSIGTLLTLSYGIWIFKILKYLLTNLFVKQVRI